METEKESDLLTKTPKAQYRWANDELVATTLNGISPQISEPLTFLLWMASGLKPTTPLSAGRSETIKATPMKRLRMPRKQNSCTPFWKTRSFLFSTDVSLPEFLQSGLP
jgi:hypothetical protein